jgi:predicted lysophospholipase L1 biosynthesis ABC-type transport system permease subunit
MLPKQVLNVVPAGAGVAVMKEEYGRSLQILFGVCGLVLLIACANVANLLLARGVARRGQTAIRMAIGASRKEIVLQALMESVLLAIGGAIAGLVVAMAAARLLLALAFQNAHFLPISTAPSLLVLGFAFMLALVTGTFSGQRLHGSPPAQIPRTRCADRVAAIVIDLLSHANRCSSCRPRFQLFWWPAQPCWRAA